MPPGPSSPGLSPPSLTLRYIGCPLLLHVCPAPRALLWKQWRQLEGPQSLFTHLESGQPDSTKTYVKPDRDPDFWGGAWSLGHERLRIALPIPDGGSSCGTREGQASGKGARMVQRA